jgi:hypothetical protein
MPINKLPPSLDIIAYAGDDTEVSIRVTDSNEVPIDLTGQHRAKIKGSQAEEYGLDIIIGDIYADQGIVNVIIPSEVSSAVFTDSNFSNYISTKPRYVGDTLISGLIFEGVWDWDLTVTDDTKTYLRGKMVIVKDVTE